MSMMCSLLGVSPEQIRAIKADPDIASSLVMGAEGFTPSAEHRMQAIQDALAAMHPEMRKAVEGQLNAVMKQIGALNAAQPSAKQPSRKSAGPSEPRLELEKSWHMLHYLFTGSTEPSRSPEGALMSGEEIGEDMGYGPPRLHDEKATAAFARSLEGLDADALAARLSYDEMIRAGVYGMPVGGGSAENFEDELREEVAYYFPLLRSYVAGMAKKQYGLLVWII
jgi:hypothetical protein